MDILLVIPCVMVVVAFAMAVGYDIYKSSKGH